MKRSIAFIAGIILGLLLPYLFGRSLQLNITHEFKLPVKTQTK